MPPIRTPRTRRNRGSTERNEIAIEPQFIYTAYIIEGDMEWFRRLLNEVSSAGGTILLQNSDDAMYFMYKAADGQENPLRDCYGGDVLIEAHPLIETTEEHVNSAE